MRVSLSWLRELVPVAAEDGEIADALTARGLTVDAVEKVGDDVALEIDVPANRPDALGHLGVAREIGAAFRTRLAPRKAGPKTGGAPADATVGVSIEAPDLCGRFTAGIVRGVKVGPSPPWVVRRLEACGQRSISNVVDASNLVMLELGQPVHFFDLKRVAGPAIRVRRADDGERFTTLDGVERVLDAETLVIADAERAVGLAGIMGGRNSEIDDDTTDVLVEVAWFLPSAIRRAARRLGMSTDASQRFERGCDPEMPPAAQAVCAALLAEIAGGVPASGIVDALPAPIPRRKVSVRLARASSLLGMTVSAGEAEEALAATGGEVTAERAGALELTVPTWRVDLEREADLVEEIGKHLGYDRVPTAAVPLSPAGAGVPADTAEERVRDRLSLLGFHEAFHYAMIGEGEDDGFVPAGTPPPLAIANPISEALSKLRRSILPALARSAAANLRRGVEDVRLFEVGRVFSPRAPGEFPEEPLRVGIAWSGAASPRHWSSPARAVDLWDLAGLVEAACSGFRPEARLTRGRDSRPGLQPGRAIVWTTPDGKPTAWCGRLHPSLAASLEAPAPVYLAEIDLDALLAEPASAARYRPVPRVPGSVRDLAVVLEAGVPAGALLGALRRVEPPAPVTMTVVDRYSGSPLAEGEASLTVRVMLQPVERTLTDEETERYRAALVETVAGLSGARMRAGT